MISFKILITGPPKCGKSTLIRRLINQIREGFTLYGFLTPEVRKSGKRIGFNLKDIKSGETTALARKGDYNSKFTLGSYKIFIDQFNHFLSKSLIHLNGNEIKSNQHRQRIIIIDEIGKMELFSEKFQSMLKKIFSSNQSIIATIGKHLAHPIKEFVMQNSGVTVFSLTRKNQGAILDEILNIIKGDRK
jgi:nucleoside-triphosphatase